MYYSVLMLSNCLVSYLVVTFHSLFFISGGLVGVPAGILCLRVAGAGTLLYPSRVMGVGGCGFQLAGVGLYTMHP